MVIAALFRVGKEMDINDSIDRLSGGRFAREYLFNKLLISLMPDALYFRLSGHALAL
jgi:hypothetical protein